MKPARVNSLVKRPRFLPITSKYVQEMFYRNVWCDFYEVCLDEAAANDLYLDCSLCPYRQTQRKYYTLSHDEVIGCATLLGAVFAKNTLYPPSNST